MQNKFSMRHKSVIRIIRECKTLERLHEVVLTMPDPIISIDHKNGHVSVFARNTNGVCVYMYHNQFNDLTFHEIKLLDSLNDI